jgi:peptide/nickel transport system permease protein
MEPRATLRKLWAPIGRTLKRHNLILIWVTRRAITAVAYLLMVLTILFFIFDIVNPYSPTGPATCASVVPCASNWWGFVSSMFAGQWGQYMLPSGNNIPTITYVSYYLPYTIELSVLALLLSLAIAYPLGLLSGWRPGRYLDGAVRTYTAVWLFVPVVVICLFLLLFLYEPFVNYSGDVSSVFGTLPSAAWFDTNLGGTPSWIGLWGGTSPTGFPLIDAAWNRAWTVEWFILLKVMLEAAVIALSYVAVFLRYARNATVEATRAEFLRGGRARGVPDRSLLWHHTGRRVIPLYVFTIGNTFGSLILIQSVVEFLFDSHGLLYVLLFNGGAQLFGGASSTLQEPLMVAILFLIAIALLVVNIVAELVAMVLDPSWLSQKEKGRT